MGCWYDAIWSIHQRHFDDPWQEHLASLNQRCGLTGEEIFLTHGRTVPPPWFNGDIETVRPSKWILMVSLNPRVLPSNQDAVQWYDDQAFNPNTYWQYWRRFNVNHWYSRFFRPRVRLASRILGESITSNQEPLFATERMIFIELCPYGSGSFTPSVEMVKDLSRTDKGFRIASEVRRLLIELGKPAAVVVNGNLAVDDFEALDGDNFSWAEMRYESVESLSGRTPGRELWHRQGLYGTQDGHSIPVIGCPFLRTPKGFNWNSEIDQLGDNIRRFIKSR